MKHIPHREGAIFQTSHRSHIETGRGIDREVANKKTDVFTLPALNKMSVYFRIWLLCCAGFILSGSVQSAPGWTLVWSDEFSQADGSSPDAAKWAFDLGGGGWGNGEWETYTARTNNARIEGGQLVIEARQETFTGLDNIQRDYTSARLETKATASWAYGRMEARIKIPRGQGIWPAFWMLGTNIDSGGWPACGEIDILENVGFEPAIVHGTAHGPGYSGGGGIGGPYTLPGGAAFADGFHVFAVEWETNRIQWYVDDQIYFTITPASLPEGAPWVFTGPQFILLNVAVGGGWPGYPDGTTTFPQRMLVDYVRVYAPTNTTPGTPSIVAAPTPTAPAHLVKSMYNSSGTYTNLPGIVWFSTWGDITSKGDFTIPATTSVVKRYTGLQYTGVEFYSPLIDVRDMTTLHVDVWTPDANQFGIKLVSTVGGEYQLNLNSSTITSNTWVSLDIPISQFTAGNPAMDMSKLMQLLWVDNGTVGTEITGGTFYMDNVYFWSNNIALPPVTHPTLAAPTATRLPANVISMYNSSGAYSDRPIDSWLAGWSGAALADHDIVHGGVTNTVKKYSNLSYAGVEFYGAKHINVSGMDTLHVDVWTPDANQFGIKLVSLTAGTQDPQVNITNIATGGWVSLDIPLSSFPGLSLTNLQQLLWVDNGTVGGGATLGTFFIDNVYFYKSVTPGNGNELVIVTNGLGTLKALADVTGGMPTNGAALLIGYNNYTITATPGSDYLFSNWVVQGASPYTTTTAKLVFTMESNLVLTANFVANRFLGAAGSYNGLFSHTNGVTLTNAGYFSGKVQALAGQPASFTSGKLYLNGSMVSVKTMTFGLDGRAVSELILRDTAKHSDPTPLTLRVQLPFDGSDTLSGTVSNENWVADLVADRAVFGSGNPATNYAGKYTMLIPGTNGLGDGYGMLTIDTYGTVKLAGGRLADGMTFGQKTSLSKNGAWPLFSAGDKAKVAPQENRGTIMGWVTVSNAPNLGLRGDLVWLKKAGGAKYPGGLSHQTRLLASPYADPGFNALVISLTGGQGMVFLDEGGLSGTLSNAVSLQLVSGKNQFVITNKVNQLSLSLTPKTGRLTGTFLDPVTMVTGSIRGVLLANQNGGGGYFLLPATTATNSGTFLVLTNRS